MKKIYMLAITLIFMGCTAATPQGGIHLRMDDNIPPSGSLKTVKYGSLMITYDIRDDSADKLLYILRSIIQLSNSSSEKFIIE